MPHIKRLSLKRRERFTESVMEKYGWTDKTNVAHRRAVRMIYFSSPIEKKFYDLMQQTNRNFSDYAKIVAETQKISMEEAISETRKILGKMKQKVLNFDKLKKSKEQTYVEHYWHAQMIFVLRATENLLMKKVGSFTANILERGNGMFSAICPELDVVTGVCKTKEIALANLKKMVERFFEDDSTDQPKKKRIVEFKKVTIQ